MKTPLPKFPHHRGVPEHHFGDKTPLLATLNDAQTKDINNKKYWLHPYHPRAVGIHAHVARECSDVI